IHVDYSKRNPTDPGLASSTPVDCSLETTAETCARAMKEMGIRNSRAGEKPDGSLHPPNLVWQNFNDSRERVTGTPITVVGDKIIDGHVLCIPVPAGLRR
ncbi:hypothetical protein LCGC14_2742750, partial [marine sediment metagenome]